MPSGRGVVVTGGASFIGSHLVDRPLADGHRVTVLDAVRPDLDGAGWLFHLAAPAGIVPSIQPRTSRGPATPSSTRG